MAASIIDGRAIAKKVRAEVAEEVERFKKVHGLSLIHIFYLEYIFPLQNAQLVNSSLIRQEM